jgi:hypothetical protein
LKTRIFTTIAALFVSLLSFSQTEDSVAEGSSWQVEKVHRQQSFGRSVPHGDYSGIAYLGDNRYAVVSDKSATCGFFVFRIDIDSISGRIKSARNEGFRSAASPNCDQEGVAFVPQLGTLFISGEADNKIKEYALDGHPTGRELDIPSTFREATSRYGFESLTYNAHTRLFWTTTESTLPADGHQATATNRVRNKLRLQSFGLDLRPRQQYFYEMDEPAANSPAASYAMGVSELCALDDGSILVLEREFFVPKRKLGAFALCKLYLVNPSSAAPGTLLPKRLLLEFRTRLSLFHFAIANYEGLCLGPTLAGGQRVLVMVSDSQSGYKGVLKDWFKTIVLAPPCRDGQ